MLPDVFNFRQKKSFHLLQCRGSFQKKIFSKLDRVCDDCYSLFKIPEVHTLCRLICETFVTFFILLTFFSTDFFYFFKLMLPYVVLMIQLICKVPSWVHCITQIGKLKNLKLLYLTLRKLLECAKSKKTLSLIIECWRRL